MTYDEDIAALDLSEPEKNGLQIFRNYKRSFDAHAETQFAREIDQQGYDFSNLRKLLGLIVFEDVRFVPVIACAYVDDILKKMFNNFVPDSVPGGKKNLLGPYGPVSDLSSRIKLAYVFGLASRDLLEDLDKLRSTRNDLAHAWDSHSLTDYFTRGRASQMSEIEKMAADKQGWLEKEPMPEQGFRIRVIWLLIRISFEAPWYAEAKKRRLHAESALFGEYHPKLMTEFAFLAREFCRLASKEYSK